VTDVTATDVVVGLELPPVVRTTGFPAWNRYAAVNDEFVPIHMDDEAGKAAGMSGAFGMGSLQWAYLHNLVRDWLGDSGRILFLECKFRAVNTKEQAVSSRARVSAVQQREDGLHVELEVWTEDQYGTVLAPGRCIALIDGPASG
jgi:acyl dehydratase